MTRNIEEFVNHNPNPSAPGQVYAPEHVAVLLALYDGAKYLEDQLESLARQTHSDWSLIISDDGSQDGWMEIVSGFSRRRAPNRVWITSGPRKGFAANFLSLVMIAGPIVPFAAFCDQDDVWMHDKLARALTALRKVPVDKPAMYCGRSLVCSADLESHGPSPLFSRKPDFRNALVQNIGGGNTMVLNRAALDLVQDTYAHAKGVVAHDWWVYQIVTGAGGKVIYDQVPCVFYRQHDTNRIGANMTWRESFGRLMQLFAGRFRIWNTANIAALEKAAHWLRPEARETLDAFKEARGRGAMSRLIALRKAGLYRQTFRGTLALWLATLVRKL